MTAYAPPDMTDVSTGRLIVMFAQVIVMTETAKTPA